VFEYNAALPELSVLSRKKAATINSLLFDGCGVFLLQVIKRRTAYLSLTINVYSPNFCHIRRRSRNKDLPSLLSTPMLSMNEVITFIYLSQRYSEAR